MRLIVPGPVAVMLALGLLAPCGTMFPVPAQARPTVEQVARLQGELLSALTANNPAAAAALMSDAQGRLVTSNRLAQTLIAHGSLENQPTSPRRVSSALHSRCPAKMCIS